MMATLTLPVSHHWTKEDLDYGVVCMGCAIPVFGPYYQLHIRVASESSHKVDEVKLCETCKEIVEA